MSGHQFIAFSTVSDSESLLHSEPYAGDNSHVFSTPPITALLRIVPTSSPRSLDQLAKIFQASEAARRTDQRQLNIFLTPEPPGTEVDRLHQIFQHLPRDYILRNMMVTRDEDRTLETFLALTKAAEGNGNQLPIDPSPPFMGPFPRAMEVRNLNKSNGAVLNRGESICFTLGITTRS